MKQMMKQMSRMAQSGKMPMGLGGLKGMGKMRMPMGMGKKRR